MISLLESDTDFLLLRGKFREGDEYSSFFRFFLPFDNLLRDEVFEDDTKRREICFTDRACKLYLRRCEGRRLLDRTDGFRFECEASLHLTCCRDDTADIPLAEGDTHERSLLNRLRILVGK